MTTSDAFMRSLGASTSTLDQQLSALTPYARAFYTQCSAKADPIQALACLQQAMQMRPPAGMAGYEGTGSLTDGWTAGRVLETAAVVGVVYFLGLPWTWPGAKAKNKRRR